ncbi:MAG: hypothetical protein WAQ25_04720 [Candidatus Saccharimonas sp.]
MNEEQQTTEVRETNLRQGATNVQRQTVRQTTQADGRVVASRVVWYIVGFIVSLLVLRVLLFLFAANQGAAFVDFLYAISGVFAAPFYGIFPQPAYGASVLDSASLVAIAVYTLVGWGIAKLFTLNRVHDA